MDPNGTLTQLRAILETARAEDRNRQPELFLFLLVLFLAWGSCLAVGILNESWITWGVVEWLIVVTPTVAALVGMVALARVKEV